MASISQSDKQKKHKRKDRQTVKREEEEPLVSGPSPKKARHAKFEAEQVSTPISPKSPGDVSAGTSTDTLGWPTDDLNILIQNLAKCLPKNDTAKFSTLIDKLDWEKVRFGAYTAQQCKDKWQEVMLRLRRYRTLTDMVTDARVWIKAPWQTYNNARKVKHPDLPKKPLTPFFRYFMEKREKTGKSHPSMSVTDLAKLLSTKYQSLNDRKKQRYKEAYDREYEEYKQKIEKFKIDHPEVEFGSMNKTHTSHGHAQEGPPKPKTPAQLFMEEKMKKVDVNSPEKRKEAIEKIKKQWAQLSEGKRIKWIRRSLLDEQRYESDLMEYIKEHPSFEPNKSRAVLTKNEKGLKDKFDGKPERPPNSGYSLFSKIMLKELKDVASKEKMVVIAKRWKELSENERQAYNRDSQKLNTKYVEKFNAYLEQLPEAEKTKLLSENKLKLPSEKKLKQQQNLPKLQSLNAQVEDPMARENAAIMNFQLDRFPVLKEKFPEKEKSELMKMAIQEWKNKLSEKKKAKYYKAGELIASSMPTSKDSQPKPSPVKEKLSAKAQELMKREPKKPPKSGYALFTSEQLSTLKNFEPKRRMQEIARKWNTELTKDDKENYDKRCKQMIVKYEKELTKFKSSLSTSDLAEYESLQSRNKKGRSKPIKSEDIDPVVDDSNVIETVDVSTTGNAADSSDESGESSDGEVEETQEAEAEEQSDEEEDDDEDSDESSD